MFAAGVYTCNTCVMGTRRVSGARARELLRRRRAQKKCVRSVSPAPATRAAPHTSEREREEIRETETSDVSPEPEEDEEEEEEEDIEGEEAHSHLLSAISGLDRQRRRGQRSEATPTVSQYQLTGDGEGVKVGGLLKGVEEARKDVGKLRRQLATPSSHQLLPPATKGEVEQAHRALAYSAASREVGKWLPVVTHNRKAAHLMFPLQQDTVPPPSLSSEGFQAVTELEKAVQGVLDKSQAVVEAADEELTAAERARLVRVMGEEGRERVRESRRWRALLSQYEAKCQRERRIKSRRFHKLQRRRKEKASGEGGRDETGEGEETEKAERLRARERMTLRHSRQAKWARQVLARGGRGRDGETRTALSEHSQRGHALTHHPPQQEDSDDGEVAEDTNAMSQSHSLDGHYDNPWLQKSTSVLLLNSDLSSQPQIEGEEEQEVNFDPSDQLIEDGGCASDEEVWPQTQSDDVTSSKSTDITSSVAKNRPTPHIDPTAFLTPRNEVGVALGVASERLLQVHEAFAGDDVVGEFETEKRENEREEEEELALQLPGWGVWGGDGMTTKKKKMRKPQTKVKPKSDREPGHVIIGNHGNPKFSKHLVKKLPWPYSTPQQFARAQATPLGRHWNSEVIYRQMVTPRVQRSVGVAIPPLQLTDDVREFMRRAASKKREQQRTHQSISDITTEQ